MLRRYYEYKGRCFKSKENKNSSETNNQKLIVPFASLASTQCLNNLYVLALTGAYNHKTIREIKFQL